MPRLARTVAVGFAHHITQRGNNRQDVFFVDDDRRVYLELLKEQADKYSLELIGYCQSADREKKKLKKLTNEIKPALNRWLSVKRHD
jgi:REP element-mobilizing transposase RayT